MQIMYEYNNPSKGSTRTFLSWQRGIVATSGNISMNDFALQQQLISHAQRAHGDRESKRGSSGRLSGKAEPWSFCE
jgi:hypothetical protein